MSLNEDLSALQQTWRAPLELTQSGSRNVRLSAGGIVFACFAALMFAGAIAAGVGLSRLSARQQRERESLRNAGVEVPAVITRHWHTGGKDDTPKIAYEFAYGERTYHGSSDTPRRIWRSLSVGSPIAVRVVPLNPELNHPAEWESDGIPRVLPGILAALLVMIGMLMVFVIRREMRLLSEGRPAPGRVTKCRRVKDGHMLRYEFLTLDGSVVNGRGDARKAQPIGATLCVLYDRDNPKRNAPYPMKLVRIDR
jgi:hypothetical protein